MSLYFKTRYSNTEAYMRNGNTLLVGIRAKQRYDLTNAQSYIWIQGDTIEGVAFQYYGDTALWWAIMDANPTLITEVEIKPGYVLAIPDYEEVVSKL